MTARADILAGTHKTNTAALNARRVAGDGAMADLFVNFVGYASATWLYSAQSGSQTAADLLAGDGAKNVACATLRQALLTMVREDLGLEASGTDINQNFATKPDLKCFDARVTGNVGNRGAATFGLACHFSSHYFLKTGDRYYDPCLTAVYTTDKGPIAHTTTAIAGLGGPSTIRVAGAGKALIILKLLAGRSVHGFGSVWELLTPDEVKGALSPLEFTAFKKNPLIVASKLF